MFLLYLALINNDISTDKLLQKLDHLERTSKVYEGIANRARQVLTHANELALDHSGISNNHHYFYT